MKRHTSLVFRKSSYSHISNCVEVANLRSGAAVRDTKNRASGHLEFSTREWASLLSTLNDRGAEYG